MTQILCGSKTYFTFLSFLLAGLKKKKIISMFITYQTVLRKNRSLERSLPKPIECNSRILPFFESSEWMLTSITSSFILAFFSLYAFFLLLFQVCVVKSYRNSLFSHYVPVVNPPKNHPGSKSKQTSVILIAAFSCDAAIASSSSEGE